MDIRTKRVYESALSADGTRVLVDRLWPRGLTKEKVRAKLWLKDVAPSTILRKWFGHDRDRWPGFKARYFLELDAKPEAIEALAEVAARSRLTLLFAAQDSECNQAVALKEYLSEHAQRRPANKGLLPTRAIRKSDSARSKRQDEPLLVKPKGAP